MSRRGDAASVAMPHDEAERIAALGAYQILDSEPEPAFDRIVAMAARLFGTPISLVTLVAEDRQWFKAKCGLDVSETSREVSFCAQAMYSSKPMVVCDASRDSRFHDNPLVTGPMSIRFYAGAPLRTSRGLPMGTLCVIDTLPRALPGQELLDSLEDLAFLASQQMELRLATSSGQQAARELRLATARLEEAQRLAHIGHWEFNVRTQMILWSDETYRLFGLPTGSEISFDLYLSLVAEEDRQTTLAAVKECVENGTPYCFTQRVRRRDGSLIYVEGRGRAEADESGNALRLLGTVADITDRKKAEIVLREANEDLERRVNQRTEMLEMANASLRSEIGQHELTQRILTGQNKVLQSIAAGCPIEEVFQSLLEFGQNELGKPIQGGILLRTGDGERLRWVFAPTLPKQIWETLPEVEIGPENGTAAGAAFFRRQVVLPDLKDSTWPGARLFREHLDAGSLASAPILNHADEVLGTVSFACSGDHPTEYELRVQRAAASVAAVVLLRDQEQAKLRQWEQMFRHASWGMALVSAETEKLLVMNEAFALLLGRSIEELESVTVFSAYGQHLLTSRLLEPGCFAERGHLSYETEWQRKDGKRVPVWIDIAPIFDGNGRPCYWAANVQDITEHKKASAELHEAFRQYQFLADFAPQIFWTADADGWVNYFNQNWYSYTGMTIEEAEGWGWGAALHPDDLDGCAQKWKYSLQSGAPFESEVRLKRMSDGEYRWQLTRAVPFRSESGEIVKWFGTCTEIHQQLSENERLEVEVTARTKDLQRSLTEKETLLKEVHHRVKNNLQVISSLLRMQAATLRDSEAAAVLKESQQRVMSMALIHDRLYNSHRMDEIDFGSYTKTLVEELFSSYAVESRVTGRVDASSVMLNIDQAIPCGLILNELVTNALKYAYPGKRQGEVVIELKELQAGRVRLVVRDEGVGLPATWKLATAQSLGLPIVDLLAKQLGGRLTIEQGKGSSFLIDFPMNQKEEISSVA